MSGNRTEKQIFLHLGMGKTGTKFLQYKVFPRFRGICYVQRTRYRKWHRIIPKLDCERILASNEFDRQMKRECENSPAIFPELFPFWY